MSNQASQVAHINAMDDNFYNETNCKARYHLVGCPVIWACLCQASIGLGFQIHRKKFKLPLMDF
jgi:hypothetical protein